MKRVVYWAAVVVMFIPLAVGALIWYAPVVLMNWLDDWSRA